MRIAIETPEKLLDDIVESVGTENLDVLTSIWYIPCLQYTPAWAARCMIPGNLHISYGNHTSIDPIFVSLCRVSIVYHIQCVCIILVNIIIT